jgi:hypothetical protein
VVAFTVYTDDHGVLKLPRNYFRHRGLAHWLICGDRAYAQPNQTADQA